MDQIQELNPVRLVLVQPRSGQKLAIAVPREHLWIRSYAQHAPLVMMHWAPLRLNAFLVQLADLVTILQKELHLIVVQIVRLVNGVVLLQETLLPFVKIVKVEDLVSQLLLPP
jgi:hypothetical protein